MIWICVGVGETEDEKGGKKGGGSLRDRKATREKKRENSVPGIQIDPAWK